MQLDTGSTASSLQRWAKKQEAITEGKRAVELLPESEDAFDGPRVTATLAQIYAWTGEFDEAFRLLDHLLVVPNGLTVPMLKLDPAGTRCAKTRASKL